MKRCSKCDQEKDESEFYVDARSKRVPKAYMPNCKACTLAANRASYSKDPQKVNARSKAWRLKNPGRATARSRAWQLKHPERAKAIAFKSQYSIDFDTWWDAQKGLCACCGQPMQRGGKEPLSSCVDHDRACCSSKRSCGKCVRGLIHRNCNLVLGYAKDDAKVLKAAAAYLERWSSRVSVDSPAQVNPLVEGS